MFPKHEHFKIFSNKYIIYIYMYIISQLQTKCFMVINKLQILNIVNFSFIKLFSLKKGMHYSKFNKITL